MTGPAGAGVPGSAATADLLTLVHGTTVCISEQAGDVRPAGYQGVYRHDIRLVSRLGLTVDGYRPRLLAARRDGAGTAHWIYGLAATADGNPTAIMTRTRAVGDGVRERFAVRACNSAFGGADVHVAVESDFADLLALRRGGPRPPPVEQRLEGSARTAGADAIAVRVAGHGAGVSTVADGFAWAAVAPPGEAAVFALEIAGESVRDHPADGFVPAGQPPETLVVRTRSGRWARSVASALSDLRALRVEVPSMRLRYVAAGAPWYVALFGRDTLLTAWESLPAGPQRGLEVLRALAAYQGTAFDAATLEQPGRIPHELRTGLAGVFGVEPGRPYYGTVDASPLFVMLLAELHRWGAPADQVRALLPAARAALDWCLAYGDLDGDGFVEYRADPGGLANQGWKDSGDALVHADGTPAEGPIALAEVQGYTYAACRGLAALEARLGEPGRAGPLEDHAARLRAAFAEAFWLPDQGTVALALDGAKRPLAVATSQIGHVLWSGILPPDVAGAAADRLERRDLAGTWGLRTLASTEVAYNPLGYHVGSIWPHDTAIGVAGLVRYGRIGCARRLVDGLLAAAEGFGWRLPELYGGIDADDLAADDAGSGAPVPYPVACSPQAWSAAAPLLLLRAMLRLDPDVPAGAVQVAPVLADGEEVEVSGIPIGGGFLHLRARGSTVDVVEAPPGVRVVRSPRPGA